MGYEIQTNYSFDHKKGEVRSKLTGWRMLLMSADSWRSLQNGLYRKFPDKASLIILEMGFDYGSNLAAAILGENARSKKTSDASGHDDLPTSPPSPNLIASILTETVRRVGWGVLSISGELQSGTAVSFTVDNCGFCAQTSSSDYPCNFFRGTALGIATRFYSKEYISSTSCANQNGLHQCKINLVSK